MKIARKYFSSSLAGLVVAALLTPQMIPAQAPTTTSGVTTSTSAVPVFGQVYPYVNRISVSTDNYVYIGVATTNGLFSPQHFCSNPSYARSTYTLNDDRTKAWLQMALQSYQLKKQVYVENAGCGPTGYLTMSVLQLQP